MSPILKLDRHDPKRELEFELDYLTSLTTQQRYALMFRRSREMMERMIRHGHIKPVEIIKRPARPVHHHRRNRVPILLATDIHPSAAGVTFEAAWKNRVKDKIEGVSVFVAGLDDLIKMNRAANRPKDHQDLQALNTLKKRKR